MDYISDPEDRERAKSYYDRALNGEHVTHIAETWGTYKTYFESSYAPIFDKDNNVIGAAVLGKDITLRMQEHSRVLESERNFRMLYSSMEQGLAIHQIVVDGKGKPINYKIVDINDSYEKLFHVRREDLIGRYIKDAFPQIEEEWIETFGHVALSGESAYLEKFSSSVGRFLSTYSYSLGDGKFAVLISDITDRIAREKEIEFLSYNDQLTELHNRRYYEDKFVELDTPENLPLSLIMGDVNGLKLVNDSFGHLVGDELLRKVSQILRDSCRD